MITGTSRHASCRRSASTTSNPSISGMTRSSRIPAGNDFAQALERGAPVFGLGLDNGVTVLSSIRRSNARTSAA